MVRKLSLLLVAVVLVAFAWLTFAPPDLIRVGANYSAKMICSNVVLANRDPQMVLKTDVQAPGHPLLKLMRVSVDERGEYTVVRTGLFGFIGKGLAFGNKKRGCTNVPDPRLLGIAGAVPSFSPPDVQLQEGLWPQGNDVATLINTELDAVLNDQMLTGEGMRAIVVIKNGEVIAERYGQGFTHETPLLGWSMTKTVTAALVGAAVKAGKIQLDTAIGLDGWSDDDRSTIRLYDLMGMASDLKWNEGYGSVSDVTRMLYLEPDMAAFVSSQPIDTETPEPTGDIFQYSSGTTVLIARILQNALGDGAEEFPSKALFEPLGMASAVLETDASGTFAGSSYLYANARDWARFGQFLMQRGVWNGQSILPAGYVDWMTDPHPAANNRYGRGQTWLKPPKEPPHVPQSDLPVGTFWATGHDGQSIAIIPQENLVIVRMGLTPSVVGYRPGPLAEAIIQATR